MGSEAPIFNSLDGNTREDAAIASVYVYANLFTLQQENIKSIIRNDQYYGIII